MATETMTKHTPGPWEIGENVGTGEPVVTFQARDICTVDKRDGEANARLIAAAPDLLAACKALRPLLSADLNALDGWEKEIEAMEAAIAKATQ